MAAAGSDARMNGCELPVIINSGSGNQGITASVPVLVYAEEFKVDEDKKYRALALSNLTAIHQKTPKMCIRDRVRAPSPVTLQAVPKLS